MKIVKNALVKDYTTYKLTGTIKEVIYPDNEKELVELLKKLKGKKYKVIGNGSNLIFLDNYNGTIIKLDNFNKLEMVNNIVKVGAGYSLIKLAIKTANNSLSGLEFASGIPGTVGGAICMNAGAYNKEVKDIVKDVTAMDENGNIILLTSKELKFGYRTSILKQKKYICLSATFRLEKKEKEEIIDLIKQRKQKRLATQPLNYPSAGSVFTNPKDDYAGRLIEQANLKGYKIGGAEISTKHANFIINKNKASGKDVKQLIEYVQKEIKEKYNIELKTEQEIVK